MKKFIHADPLEILSQDINTTTINGGRWYITPDGTFPSVTTVLSHEPKQWLTDWGKRIGEDKASKEKQRCSVRGEIVHTLCEMYIKNLDIDTLLAAQPRSIQQLFNKIKILINGNVDHIIAQECALWSNTIGLAGRVDCVGHYSGVKSIIDFKTANNDKNEHDIIDYFIQCTAYALMYNEMCPEESPIEDIVVIITTEKGLFPQVFKKKIDDYIYPLLHKYNKFVESV